MPPTLTYPGLYVQEVASGVRPIAGVSTGTTLFIAASGAGPLKDPTLVLNYDDFVDKFGSDTTVSELPRQVKLFFQNNGQVAYVMRIASGATAAAVVLQNTAGAPVLDIEAANPGARGEQIRLQVSYRGTSPDSTFDLEVMVIENSPAGIQSISQPETFTGLTMDPTSSRYAPSVLTQTSQHINANESAGAPAAGNGVSLSGLAVPWRNAANTTFRDQWGALIGTNGPAATDQTLLMQVDGGDPVPIDLSSIDVATIAAASVQTDLANAIANVITVAHTNFGRPGVNVTVNFEIGPSIATVDDALHGGTNFDVTSILSFTSTTGGDVHIRSDGGVLAQVLKLSIANGGRHMSAHSERRPAANAALFDNAQLAAIGALTHADLLSITLDGETITLPASTTPTQPIFTPNAGGYAAGRGGLDGITERFRSIRDAINAHSAATAGFDWAAELWGSRLALLRTAGSDNALLPADFATAPNDISGNFNDNTRLATVGVSGNSLGQQSNPPILASDGSAPQSTDYDAAYSIAESELDIFNLLVLPESNQSSATDRKTLWGPASIFCQQNRAFLLADPPPTWSNHTEPVDGTGVNDSITDLRIGLVKDHAAVHYPNLIIDENGRRTPTSPSGAVAGLMARTDENTGVWKAPAGTVADIRGIVGIQQAFSDKQNGNLNPKGINTIRRFPNGIVNWGARTMDDDSGSEYRYVPIRRLLLYLEESTYRGLQWTVFEPNGADLWAAIRLNVSNFLEGLRRRGAFAGTSASESYFVKCDAETTTPTDRNLGVVNVHIGVATLKPAEFVLLYFKQITLPEQ